MRKPYRPRTVATEYLKETLGIIEACADDYASRRETARQKYDEFMAWKKESPQEVAEWREERKRIINTQGRMFADDDPVEVYQAFLQSRRDEEYDGDAARLRAIITDLPASETAVTDEIYEIVDRYNHFVRPVRFWEKEEFKGIPGLLLIAAAIYYFDMSAVGWLFIGISGLVGVFFFRELAKGGGRVNGIMLLPAIILLIIGGLMVGTDAVMELFE